MDDPSTTLEVHLDTLEYTREGLRTRTPIDLTTGRHNRVNLVRPKLAAVPLTAQHGFALDRAFPLPATLALLWAYRAADSPLPAFEVPHGPKSTLQVFGHADASGDEAHNKTLSERRAAVLLALLQSDVDAMLAIADDDGWTPWEYQVLLRVLGSDPGPTDGDPGALTDLGLAHFAQRYVSGFFHPSGQPRLPDLDARAFDAPTVEALLDAFVSAHAPDLSGCTLHALRPSVGCSEFNPLTPEGGSQNRRVSLLAALDDPHPENAPCTEGDAGACAVVGEGEYTCMWYREHVAAEPAQAAAFYDPRWLQRADGSYVLSVLTNLPDDAPVVFDVFGNEQPLPSTSPFEDLVTRWSDPLTTASVGGVATTTWTPPADVIPGADDSPVPVFRTSSASQDAHLWATWSDIVGVQLLDDTGRCFAGIAITLETPSGAHALTTDANGIAWVRERSDDGLSVTLPEDLLLPHPRDTVTVADARTTADVETTRADVAALRSGSITRLRIQPPEAAPGYISCHFDEGSAYPADTLVALVQQALDAVETDPDVRISLFGHTRPSGSVEEDKALSDRRARLVHAVLTSDLATLEAVVEADHWAETHYMSLAHFLGYVSDDPAELWDGFQFEYSAGHHHAPGRNLGDGHLDRTGKLDPATKHALLEAFLAAAGTSIPSASFAETPCAGCGSFNPGPGNDHADRATLTVFPAGTAPTAFPCRIGDAKSCYVVAGQPCSFFAERCRETPLRYRWLDDGPKDGEDILYMGSRVLVHEGLRVAGAVYGAPPIVESVSYAFTPPTAPSGAPLGIAPRVHLSRPGDKLGARLNKASRIRGDATPEGDYIRPVAWTDDHRGRQVDDFLGGFWGDSLAIITKNSTVLDTPDIQKYRPLLNDALVTGSLPIIPDGLAFDAYRLLTRAEFLRYFVLAGMIAAGQVLNPLESTRYASNRAKRIFACNIYAADLVELLPQGAWLPKVQFTHPGLVRRKPSRAKSEPVSAVGPSGINDFLNGRFGIGGADYGWSKIGEDPSTIEDRRALRDKAQDLANQGVLVVLSGASTSSKIGHVAVIMPDLDFLSGAEKENLIHPQIFTNSGLVHHVWDFGTDAKDIEDRAPMRSQAGGVNRHGTRLGAFIFTGKKDKFRTPGYFQYDPRSDTSRGTDVVRERMDRR